MSTNKLFSTETSERYARALYEVARESSELEKIENNLIDFLNVYDSSSEFVNFLKNPTQSNKDQIEAINIISKNTFKTSSALSNSELSLTTSKSARAYLSEVSVENDLLVLMKLL